MNPDSRFFRNAIMLVLLMPVGSSLASWFEPAQTSYTESYPVRAGETSAASGGRLGYPHVHASGRLTVKSCCGLSTNDIMFTIGNQDFSSKVFGVVIGTFSFEWDTGNNTEYSMLFNNKFDPASPSYHDKTVEISVTEVGPPNSVNIYFLVEVVGIVAVAVAAITITSILVLLRRHKQRTEPHDH
jgi:hypothetical protein